MEDYRSDFEKIKTINFHKPKNQLVRSEEKMESRMAVCKEPEAAAGAKLLRCC
jgi:hypothetical protein